MDPVTHTLCGLALARAGGDRHGPLATPTLVIAANLPDIDIVGSPIGRAWYLLHHRGITHSLVGLAGLSVALAGGMWLIGRRRADPPRLRALWGLAAVGLLSHLVLDGLNVYGVRPLLPFSDAKVYGDVAAIVDPWMWLALATACVLGGAPPKPDLRRELPWWAFAALATVALLSNGRTPPALALLWTPAMIAALIARRRGLPAVPGRRRLAARAAIGAMALYLIALGGLDRLADGQARARVAERAGAPVTASATHPGFGVPWRLRSVVATERALTLVEVDLLSGTTALGPTLARNLADPALPALAETYEHRAWRSFARLPFVARTLSGHLVLGDGRYSLRDERSAARPEAEWCNLVVPLPPAE